MSDPRLRRSGLQVPLKLKCVKGSELRKQGVESGALESQTAGAEAGPRPRRRQAPPLEKSLQHVWRDLCPQRPWKGWAKPLQGGDCSATRHTRLKVREARLCRAPEGFVGKRARSPLRCPNTDKKRNYFHFL